jgi:hypothetical protein
MTHSDQAYGAEAALRALPLPTGALPIGPLPGDPVPVDPVPVESPDAERPAHLRVAPDSRDLVWRRRRARLIVLGVAAISATSMFLLVAFHVWAVQSSFQLDKLQTQLNAEQRRYGMLRGEVATRSAPEAIARGAEALGMIRPGQVTVLRPAAAKPIDPQGDLPVPAPPPYRQIGPDE